VALCSPSNLFKAVQTSVRVARGAPIVLLPAMSETSRCSTQGTLCWRRRHGEVSCLQSKAVIDKVLAGSGNGL
jgi:hypothetical protein